MPNLSSSGVFPDIDDLDFSEDDSDSVDDPFSKSPEFKSAMASFVDSTFSSPSKVPNDEDICGSNFISNDETQFERTENEAFHIAKHSVDRKEVISSSIESDNEGDEESVGDDPGSIAISFHRIKTQPENINVNNAIKGDFFDDIDISLLKSKQDSDKDTESKRDHSPVALMSNAVQVQSLQKEVKVLKTKLELYEEPFSLDAFDFRIVSYKRVKLSFTLPAFIVYRIQRKPAADWESASGSGPSPKEAEVGNGKLSQENFAKRLFIYRRFSDFITLGLLLEREFPYLLLPHPPPKRIHNNLKESFIKFRMLQLNMYLNNLVTHDEVKTSSDFLKQFLYASTETWHEIVERELKYQSQESPYILTDELGVAGTVAHATRTRASSSALGSATSAWTRSIGSVVTNTIRKTRMLTTQDGIGMSVATVSDAASQAKSFVVSKFNSATLSTAIPSSSVIMNAIGTSGRSSAAQYPSSFNQFLYTYDQFNSFQVSLSNGSYRVFQRAEAYLKSVKSMKSYIKIGTLKANNFNSMSNTVDRLAMAAGSVDDINGPKMFSLLELFAKALKKDAKLQAEFSQAISHLEQECDGVFNFFEKLNSNLLYVQGLGGFFEYHSKQAKLAATSALNSAANEDTILPSITQHNSISRSTSYNDIGVSELASARQKVRYNLDSSLHGLIEGHVSLCQKRQLVYEELLKTLQEIDC